MFRGQLGASSETLSSAVVSAVAAAEGVDASELTEPLFDVIDPDALDALFRPNGATPLNGKLQFDYYGYEVTVYGNRQVEVHPLEEE